ncbi:MAG: hypothetical protein EZS28_048897, partial [Streblomastix strix]
VIDSKGDTALFASRKDKFPKLNRFYWSSIQYETASSGDLYGPKPVLIPSVQMVEHENQLRIQSGLDFREDDDDDNDEEDEDQEEEEEDEEDEEEDDDEQIIRYITPKKKPNPQASLLSPQVKVSYKRCSNCHDRIPEKEIVIHERHCKLTIKLCTECNFKVASGFLKKHTLLIHSNVVCSCGLQISSVRNIPMHLSTSCPASEEICPVCSIRVKRSEQSRHRLMCDSQQYSCSSCGKRIAGAKMLIHLEVEHQNKMC